MDLLPWDELQPLPTSNTIRMLAYNIFLAHAYLHVNATKLVQWTKPTWHCNRCTRKCSWLKNAMLHRASSPHFDKKQFLSLAHCKQKYPKSPSSTLLCSRLQNKAAPFEIVQ